MWGFLRFYISKVFFFWSVSFMHPNLFASAENSLKCQLKDDLWILRKGHFDTLIFLFHRMAFTLCAAQAWVHCFSQHRENIKAKIKPQNHGCQQIFYCNSMNVKILFVRPLWKMHKKYYITEALLHHLVLQETGRGDPFLHQVLIQ